MSLQNLALYLIAAILVTLTPAQTFSRSLRVPSPKAPAPASSPRWALPPG